MIRTDKPAEDPTILVVACALLSGERVLLARRPAGKSMASLWEFPGGKVEPGERPEAALIRELYEELGIEVSMTALEPLCFASHAYEAFHLLMPLYLCSSWSGEPIGRDGQELAWVRPSQMHDYAMPPADEPLVAALGAWLDDRPATG